MYNVCVSHLNYRTMCTSRLMRLNMKRFYWRMVSPSVRLRRTHLTDYAAIWDVHAQFDVFVRARVHNALSLSHQRRSVKTNGFAYEQNVSFWKYSCSCSTIFFFCCCQCEAIFACVVNIFPWLEFWSNIHTLELKINEYEQPAYECRNV